MLTGKTWRESVGDSYSFAQASREINVGDAAFLAGARSSLRTLG